MIDRDLVEGFNIGRVSFFVGIWVGIGSILVSFGIVKLIQYIF